MSELQPCGTRAAYQRHRRAGEEACDPCKAAAAEVSRRRYHAAPEARIEVVKAAWHERRQALIDALVARDGGLICYWCSTDLDRGTLQVDHVLALALGGTDDIENRVLSCRSCNRSKSSKPVDEWLAERDAA